MQITYNFDYTLNISNCFLYILLLSRNDYLKECKLIIFYNRSREKKHVEVVLIFFYFDFKRQLITERYSQWTCSDNDVKQCLQLLKLD